MKNDALNDCELYGFEFELNKKRHNKQKTIKLKI